MAPRLMHSSAGRVKIAGVPVETEAAVLYSFGAPHAIEEVELRDPGAGEVLVRILASGVCHSDVGQAHGEWALPLPAVLGHEGVGVVDALGPDVRDVEVGQKVVLSLAPGCRTCPHCRSGRPILCQDALDAMAEGRLTTGPSPIRGRAGPIATYSLLGCFARHAVVAAESAVPVPDDIPAEVAALIGCAVITGVGAATETADIEAGSRGAVIGAGGVGMNAIQGATLRGAAEVVAFDVVPERLAQAERFGATAAVDANDGATLDRFRAAARRDGFDWAIVTVGSQQAVRLGVEVTRPGAMTVVVGLLPESSPVPVDMLDLVTYEKRIVGSAYGTTSPRILMPRIARLYLDGKLALDELVTERLPLALIDEAFELSRRAKGLRPVLVMTGGNGT